jgi:hypothetical protein
MIGQTLSRISKMEQEQRMQEIQSSRRINQRWVDTLGGYKGRGEGGTIRAIVADSPGPSVMAPPDGGSLRAD